LDDDVARLLRRESRRSGASFKEAVNRYLRLGLMASKQQMRKPFVVTPRNLGPLPEFDCVAQLLEALEGPEYR
jgi:hypothetical protein